MSASGRRPIGTASFAILNCLNDLPRLPQFGEATDDFLSAFSASTKASAMVTFETTPKMHDGLRDLRTDATDNAIGTHQSGSRYGLDEMLGHQCVHNGKTRDVHHGDLGSGLYDVVEQVLHHHLIALAGARD